MMDTLVRVSSSKIKLRFGSTAPAGFYTDKRLMGTEISARRFIRD
ncbi:hypothetical protein SFC07_02785 [Corynebacterium callunae]